MTQPPEHPSGIPGGQPIQPIGIPGSPPLGQPQGPSLAKPSFQTPNPAPAAQVPTGEALVLAGWGARWAAIIIDGFVRFALAALIAVVLFVIFADDPFSSQVYEIDSDGEGISNLGGIALTTFLLYVVLPLFYAPPFMAMWNGATPGKRAVGIRVVTEAGVAPSFGQAVLRESVFKTIVIGLAGGLIFPAWFLNFLWPLWDDQSRAGHDFMARTRVVRA